MGRAMILNESEGFRPRELPFHEGVRCKVYFDGNHFVAVPHIKNPFTQRLGGGRIRTEAEEAVKKFYAHADEIFKDLYAQAVAQNMRGRVLRSYIRNGMADAIPDEADRAEFLTRSIKRQRLNVHKRKSLFRRKASFNGWAYFFTVTYSDENFGAEEEFRQKLKKYFANMSVRHGWKVMGAFERGDDTNRLHFHGLLYTPKGKLPAQLLQRREYDKNMHDMRITHYLPCVEERFGRCDFERLDDERAGARVGYILKYIEKGGEKLFYSRNIASYVIAEIRQGDIAASFMDFVEKYVLFPQCGEFINDDRFGIGSDLGNEESKT